MQESTESDSCQSSHCYPNEESFEESSKDFRAKLKIKGSSETSVQRSTASEETFEDQNQEPSRNEAEDEKETQCADDEFSFACNGVLKSPISADDAFHNGQIKPIFPLFDQTFILADEDFERSVNRLPFRPPVDKIFVETNDPSLPLTPSSSKSENDSIDEEAAGPYCSWSNKAVEDSAELCKKSNSTGFSKIWRFRDFLNRSNSEGPDAFVFLNNSTATGKKDEKVFEKSNGCSSSEKKKKMAAPAMEVKGAVTRERVKGKKGVKSEAKSLSAHEKYMKNRASSEGDRRRSYLPYRPELVGFFTNVNGGLSRNVHPF